jgi:hypothetical protein
MKGRGLHIRFELSLWLNARLMPWRIRGLSLDRLIALYEPGRSGGFIGLKPTFVIDAVRRVTHHPWAMRDRRCLRQGLLAYYYLVKAGFKPELCFGVDRQSIGNQRLSAHCWVALDGENVLNPPGETMVSIFRYPQGESLDPGKLPFRVVDANAA